MEDHYHFHPLANEPVSLDIFIQRDSDGFSFKLAFRILIMPIQVDPSLNAISSRVPMSQERVFWPKYEENRCFVDRPAVFEILDHTIKTHRECTLCGLGG